MKQLFTIPADSNVETIQPVLAIRIGEHYCSYAIIDAAGSRLTKMAHYAAADLNTGDLNEIFSANEELNRSFFNVLVCYDYPQCTIVPLEYYNANDASSILQAMCGGAGDASIISEVVPGWQMYNIYAVPKDIHEWMNNKFPAGKYWHHNSLAIKSISGADESGCISIDLGTDNFSLMAGRSNSFLLAQNFTYATPADVIYYLLKVSQQLNLEQGKVKLVLSGLIDKDSALYKELYQYFLNIEFREAIWNIDANEFPAHFFTSLNDLALCVS
ncbi:MAG: DUF3822 family protein [Bacteroidota bacterium]